MSQDTTSVLLGLTSFANLQTLWAARGDEGCAQAQLSFEAFEEQLGQALRSVENDLKALDLARYDVNAEAVIVEGQKWRKCLAQQPKTYLSSSGPVTVSRTLYRPPGGGRSVCPLELRAGIIAGLHTPVLARQVAYLIGQLTAVETSQVFTELGIRGPSSSSCDRLSKHLSEAWEGQREAWEEALRVQELVAGEAAVVAVSLDGVMVADKDAQREAKAQREAAQARGVSKQHSGPAGYREVGCGTVSVYDAEAERLETVRYARAPEFKKKTLTEQLDAELASILAVRADLTLVALADGAEENWRYFDRAVYEQATQIVDHGHASQHLRAAMNAYYGEHSVEGRAEYERLRLLLRDHDDGAQKVIDELSRLSRKLGGQHHQHRRQQLNDERRYFNNQRERMDYADYQARGLPIGSGVVEAACKTLATQRLKRSGMSWRSGKQAILTIRSLQQSGRWPRAWTLLSEHFRIEVTAVEQHGHLRELTLLKNAV